MSQDNGLSTRSRAFSESLVNVHTTGCFLASPARYFIGASPKRYRTPINAVAWQMPEAYINRGKLVPYKRMGEPEGIGRAAARLASGASDYITGTSLFPSGGMTSFPGCTSGG